MQKYFHQLGMFNNKTYLEELSKVKKISILFFENNPTVLYRFKKLNILLKFYSNILDTKSLEALIDFSKSKRIFGLWLHINQESLSIEEYLAKHNYLFMKSFIATYIIDLTLPIDGIFQKIESKRRNQIKKGIKENLIINFEYKEETFVKWWDIYMKTSERGMFLKQDKSMVKNLLEKGICRLFTAWLGDQLIAGTILVIGKYPIWWLGASLIEYSKYNASSLLQWEMVKWAKDNSFTIYDMGGATLSEDHGPTKFKKSFSGEYIVSPVYKIAINKIYYFVNSTYNLYYTLKKRFNVGFFNS